MDSYPVSRIFLGFLLDVPFGAATLVCQPPPEMFERRLLG